MKKLGLLIAPVLFALGCGGLDDVLGGVDAAVCGGQTVHRLPVGVYNNNGTVKNFSTTCNASYIDPVTTQTALQQASRVFDNQSGTYLCFSNNATPKTEWGCFASNCNMVTPMAKDQYIDDGKCNCHQKVNLSGTVNAIGVLQLNVKVEKDTCTSSTAGSCTQTTACTVSYDVTMTGPSS